MVAKNEPPSGERPPWARSLRKKVRRLKRGVDRNALRTARLQGSMDVLLNSRGIVYDRREGFFRDAGGQPMLNPDGRAMSANDIMRLRAYDGLAPEERKKFDKALLGIKEEKEGRSSTTEEERDAKGTKKFAKDTENIGKGLGNINMGLSNLFSAGAFANMLMVIVIILLIWIVMRVFFPMVP